MAQGTTTEIERIITMQEDEKKAMSEASARIMLLSRKLAQIKNSKTNQELAKRAAK